MRGAIYSASAYKWLISTLCLAMITACLGGIYDSERSDRTGFYIGWATVFLLATIGIRALRIAIIVKSDVVIVRSLYRTRSIQIEEILAVRSKAYSGMLNRYSESTLFRMLQFSLRDGEIDFPVISGRAKSIHTLAAELQSILAARR